VIRDADGRITRIRYVIPRHKAANWVGAGRSRKSTQPGASGVIELTPFEFLDRLADLIPQPRRHRHRYHGVFAPNHPLRPAVTALAVGNGGKRRDAATGGHADGRHAAEGCCNTHEKPRSHDTSRIAWAKLMARVGEEFPLLCPACGGDIRLISFITEPGPIRKILTHLGEPLETPPITPARGPPTDWGELVQAHDDCDVFQSTDRRAARDRHPQLLTAAGREVTTKPPGGGIRRDSAPTREKRHFRGEVADPGTRFLGRGKPGRREQPAHESLSSRATVAEVPLTGRSFPFTWQTAGCSSYRPSESQLGHSSPRGPWQPTRHRAAAS
jgi:hypothetical protein